MARKTLGQQQGHRSRMQIAAYLIPAGIVTLPVDAVRRLCLRQKEHRRISPEITRFVSAVVGAGRVRYTKIRAPLCNLRCRTI